MSDIFRINAHACIQCNPKTGFYESIDTTAVVDEILQHMHIVTLLENDEMLYYENGIYITGAEKKLSNIIVHNLRNLKDWKNPELLMHHPLIPYQHYLSPERGLPGSHMLMPGWRPEA